MKQLDALARRSQGYRWIFLGVWPLAQALSWALVCPLLVVVTALYGTVPRYNFKPYFNPSAGTFALAAVLTAALVGALLALLSGLLPWLVIRPLLPSSRWWLPARLLYGALLGTAWALPSAILVMDILPSDSAELVFPLVALPAVGLFVWFLLRRRVARWRAWYVAHSVGAVIGTLLAILVLVGVAGASAGSPMGNEQDRIWLRQTVIRLDPKRVYTEGIDFEGLNESLAMRYAAPYAGGLGGLVGGGVSGLLLVVLARDRFRPLLS